MNEDYEKHLSDRSPEEFKRQYEGEWSPMKYWQNEETGMCCAAEHQPSPRHCEISKEFYDLHESGTTQLAPDAGDSAVSTGSLQASALSTSQAEPTPTQRG